MEDDTESTPQSPATTIRNSSFITRRRTIFFNTLPSRPGNEFQAFRLYLRWLCIDDQSRYASSIFSWIVFVVLTVIIPVFSHLLVVACSSCDSDHRRPFDAVVQISLSVVAGLSFFRLTRILRKYGLRKFLLFDRLVNQSVTVRRNYTDELHRSLWICSVFTLPCLIVKCVYKIWWYVSGSSQIPYLVNPIASHTIACTLEILSWLYRTTMFFLACALFRLICYLQILRLQDFARVFEEQSDVASVLQSHLSIRRHLKVISHRFRWFILGMLILITISQLISLMLTTKSSTDVNIFNAGELSLTSVTLVAGLMILLHSAAKITHKGQAITSLAAKWHVCATIDSFNPTDEHQAQNSAYFKNANYGSSHGESNEEDSEHDEDEFENTRLTPAFTSTSISFQKRQALEKYFEHHKAGITVYGFMLDRTSLRLIFGTEMALILFLLKLTVNIS